MRSKIVERVKSNIERRYMAQGLGKFGDENFSSVLRLLKQKITASSHCQVWEDIRYYRRKNNLIEIKVLGMRNLIVVRLLQRRYVAVTSGNRIGESDDAERYKTLAEKLLEKRFPIAYHPPQPAPVSRAPTPKFFEMPISSSRFG